MADVARGRRLFLGVVGGLVAFSLLGTLLTHRGGLPIRPMSLLWSPGITIVIGALAYAGVYWARGAITVWMWLTAFLELTTGVALLRRWPAVSLVTFAWAAAFAYGGWFLYNQPDIEAFILRRDKAPPTPRRVILRETDE